MLVLPVVPREENSLALLMEEKGAEFASLAEPTIAMALGEAYPSSVRFDLNGGMIVREDGTFLSSFEGFVITAVTADDDALGARLVDDEHFEITAREVGDFSVLLEGNFVPPTSDAPAARSFSIAVTVRVRRIASVVWHACVHSPVRVLEGAAFRTAWHEVQAEDGVAFSPANADPSSNVEMTVHAASGTTLTAEDGLASLVAQGPEQSVRVRALGSEIGSFELVHLESADGFSARFFFGANWMRGATELSTGDSARTPRSDEDAGHIGVVPELSVRSTPVCSIALPEWFEVRANTPDTCTENGELGCGHVCNLDALPVLVVAENPGTCALSVSAPRSNAGSGMSAGLSVELAPPRE